MTSSPQSPAPAAAGPPEHDDAPASAADDAALEATNPAAGPEGEGADEPFGSHPAGRFGADVLYTGAAAGHDYVIRVRHRLLDTSMTASIDGVEHDPQAEAEAAPGGDAPADALRFRVEESLTGLRCVVRRPAENEAAGRLEDAETILVTTAGLGGAGEVEILRGLERTPLAPERGSPSAARDARRLEHPVRYALMAAASKAAGFLLPLLGIGALLSGLLHPVRRWLRSLLDPPLTWADETTRPAREAIGEILEVPRRVLDSLLEPVRRLVDAVLDPVGRAISWLLDLVPSLDVALDVPDWLPRAVVVAVVIIGAFAATLLRLRRRRALMEASREETARAREGRSAEGLTGGDEPRGPERGDGRRRSGGDGPSVSD